ncbi:VOC family protein [Streptomyces blattellae]|uniref:VOC family protein n=1 Tax=Streptomyces blattellae TaxID=2569855 RepID=UPI0012B7DCE7|nr:VOC family protein [Streptomyces blattellae]
MPHIEELAHVGIHVHDIDTMLPFYRDTLGLQVSDIDEKAGLYFLSSRPDIEHHEVLLCAGRTAEPGAMLLQQISFRCPTLQDVIDFYRKLVAEGVRFEYTVTHGNAIGVYFYDPEGNRLELYWPTGLKARQGFLLEVDLDEPPETIMERVRGYVAEHGEDGIVDMALLARQTDS